jgi:integrase
MRGLHADKGWLVFSFTVPHNGLNQRVRLYPGIEATHTGKRDPLLKELHDLIARRDWAELARRYPRNKALAPFQPVQITQDRTTVGEVIDRFLAQKRNENKPGTVDYYLNIFKSKIWKHKEFINKPIRQITASDVAAITGPLAQSGQVVPARHVRSVLSIVFNWARTELGSDGQYLVIDNPVRRTKPISYEQEDEIVDPFIPEEIKLILKACNGWQRRLVTVAFGTGLRPGENFGLKRRDVDLDQGVIHVRQMYGRYGETGLKNKHSRREIDISTWVAEALREQLRANKFVSPWLWAISSTHPEPHSVQNFSQRFWPRILERAGVKHRRFYQCRHTFATLQLVGGAEWRYIADQMGHNNLGTLQSYYWKWRRGTTLRPTRDIIAEALR